LEKKNDEKWKQ
jgi:hypothetical protein